MKLMTWSFRWIMGWLDKSICKHRIFIEGILLDTLRKIAEICTVDWHDRSKFDQELQEYL